MIIVLFSRFCSHSGLRTVLMVLRILSISWRKSLLQKCKSIQAKYSVVILEKKICPFWILLFKVCFNPIYIYMIKQFLISYICKIINFLQKTLQLEKILNLSCFSSPIRIRVRTLQPYWFWKHDDIVSIGLWRSDSNLMISFIHYYLFIVYSIFWDVGNWDDISNAQAIVSKHVNDEGLNVLINNAGCLQIERRIEEVNPETMFDHYRVNAVAPAMIIKVSSSHFLQYIHLNLGRIQGAGGHSPQTLVFPMQTAVLKNSRMRRQWSESDAPPPYPSSGSAPDLNSC